jgi:hypothetical protein
VRIAIHGICQFIWVISLTEQMQFKFSPFHLGDTVCGEYYMIPKALCAGWYRENLSAEAKLFYAILLEHLADAMESVKNGDTQWINDKGEIFFTFRRVEVLYIMGIGLSTLKRIIKDLKQCGLLKDIPQGGTKNSLVFIGKVTVQNEPSRDGLTVQNEPSRDGLTVQNEPSRDGLTVQNEPSREDQTSAKSLRGQNEPSPEDVSDINKDLKELKDLKDLKDLKPLFVRHDETPVQPSPKERKLFFNDQHMAVAKYLADWIVLNKPDYKLPKDLRPWANTVRLMVEIDKRSIQRIVKVIDFSQTNEFWFTNILSADTLRRQFDLLELKMRAKDQKFRPAPIRRPSLGVPSGMLEIAAQAEPVVDPDEMIPQPIAEQILNSLTSEDIHVAKIQERCLKRVQKNKEG